MFAADEFVNNILRTLLSQILLGRESWHQWKRKGILSGRYKLHVDIHFVMQFFSYAIILIMLFPHLLTQCLITIDSLNKTPFINISLVI